MQEVGLLAPGPTRTGALYPGQVGYMIAGERGFTYEFARICANLREFARVYACSRECCDVTFLLRHPLFFAMTHTEQPHSDGYLVLYIDVFYWAGIYGGHHIRFDSIRSLWVI